MNNEVLWFGYLAVDRNILSAEVCIQLGELFSEDADVIAYAQAVLDHELVEDFDLVQEILNDACTRAAATGAPSLNVFRPQVPSLRAEHIADDDDVEPEIDAPVVGGGIIENDDVSRPDLSGVSRMSETQLRATMDQLLRWSRSYGASDLHISAGAAPFVRKNREVEMLSNTFLTPEEASKLNLSLLDEKQKTGFEATRDLDYALARENNNRYRVNLMIHKEGVAGTYRLVPNKAIPLVNLGFKSHKTITKLLDHHNGLILITGPVGSGKTTTLASLVDLINSKRDDHIITVEDPIEIVQKSKSCNLTQREVGQHTHSFHSALKGALREDPDIIVIGELRDLETIEMAITAAETGHLVIGTLHTQDAATTLNRLLDVFPPSQQPQIRSMTSESLRGVICQKLLPGKNGGLVVANEILINTLAIANMIRDSKVYLLKQVLETGMNQGMMTMDQSIEELYREDQISQETALAHILDRQIKARIKAGGGKPPAPGAPSPAEDSKKKGWFR